MTSPAAPTESVHDLLAVALEAATAAAASLRRHFRSAALEVQAKSKNDFVTSADRESEAIITGAIRRAYAGHTIVGEEGGESAGSVGGLRWLIDPLDGTTNFLHGLPIFAISIACLDDLGPLVGVVLDPIGGNLFRASRGGGAFWNDRPMAVSRVPSLDGAFVATGYPFRAHDALDIYLAIFREVLVRGRGMRRCGAAALDLAWTAAGVFDGFFELRLSPWDVAAGALLVTEAGGKITDLDGGDSFLLRGNVIAGGSAVHDDLWRTAREHADEALLARLLSSPTPQEGAL